MRSLGNFFQEKEQKSSRPSKVASVTLDTKTIFFLFERIVREYYGKRGGGVIHPAHYEGGVLSVKVASPLWANELLIQQGELCKRLNQEVGSEAVIEIRIFHGLYAD